MKNKKFKPKATNYAMNSARLRDLNSSLATEMSQTSRAANLKKSVIGMRSNNLSVNKKPINSSFNSSVLEKKSFFSAEKALVRRSKKARDSHQLELSQKQRRSKIEDEHSSDSSVRLNNSTIKTASHMGYLKSNGRFK